MPISRRDFLERSAALTAAGFLPRVPSPEELAALDAPAAPTTSTFRARPVVVSSSNGIRVMEKPGVC